MSILSNSRCALCAFIYAFSMLAVGCGTTEQRSGSSNQVASAPVFASSATMGVGGLGCPMCAESIDILLKNVDGVTGSEVDLATGTVRVDLDPSVGVSPADLRSAVVDGGFTYRGIEFSGSN